jgi:hypothetical protein
MPNRALSEAERNRAVEHAYNLFVNYDPRPANAFGEYPPALRLCHQHELSYVNVTPDFLRAVLINYFTSALPGRGFPVTVVDDGDEATWSVDKAALATFAAECADHFVANEIAIKCFLAEPDTYSLAEHGSHMGRAEPANQIEALVDAS